MKRIFGILVSLVVVLSMIAAPVAAQEGVIFLEPETPLPAVEGGEMVDETPSLWFVELNSQPAVEGTSLATLNAEKTAFRKEANRAGLKYTERYAFSTLWNGLSIQVEAGQLSKLVRIPGVKNIYPVETMTVPQVTASEPDLFTAIDMTGASIVQSELGYTGAGIKVAVMDTGIDIDHPAFGGDGVARSNSSLFPTERIPVGYDFVGDAFNADTTSPAYNPTPVPDSIPDDCQGHGSHVAGIVGAYDPDEDLKGVAPDVTFGAYRVFGCDGSTTADIMIAAMERVLADDMDVLNMSIGSAFQWPQYPTSVAANRLVNQGVVVVTSTGNSGANGLYSASAPGVGEKVIATAAMDNTWVAQFSFTISGTSQFFGYTPATAAPAAPQTGTFSLVRTGTQTTANDGCNALPPGSLAGKIALIRRGTCGFYNKALNAQNAGAIGVVLYNNQPGFVTPTVAPVAPLTTPITIPVVMISQVDGNAIDTLLAASPRDLTWTDQITSIPNPTGGLVSSFSSYGMAPDLSLKPDIAAPGGSIWSTIPLEKGRYGQNSGTSMASPHVAGAVALLLQAHPNTSAQAVRSILQNSADPKNWWGNPNLGLYDMVHRQGAGMLDIDDAILATTKIEPGKLSLGESEFGPVTRTLTIKNEGSADVTYNLSHVPALSTGPNTFVVGAQTGFASVAFSASSVLVPAGGVATVDVTITANAALANLSQYGGYIVVSSQDGGQLYRVPYAGLKGDYQAKPALTAGGAAGFPWLARQVGTSYTRVNGPTDGIFSLASGNLPYFLVHLDHQVRALRIEIFSKSGKAWHRAYNEEYLGRNSTATGFFALPFDGTTVSGNKVYTVPDGEYYAVLSVLKANGDTANPAHWETWTSPNFVIDRP